MDTGEAIDLAKMLMQAGEAAVEWHARRKLATMQGDEALVAVVAATAHFSIKPVGEAFAEGVASVGPAPEGDAGVVGGLAGDSEKTGETADD